MKRTLCAILAAAFLTLPALAAEADLPIPPDDIVSAPVLVDGQAGEVSVIVLKGKYFYRLRDVATLLKGTTAAFDVTWDRQVYINQGETYTVDPLPPETDPASYMAAPQVFVVNGEETTVNSLLLHQHYYLPVRCLNKVIRTSAREEGGALVFELAAPAAE